MTAGAAAAGLRRRSDPNGSDPSSHVHELSTAAAALGSALSRPVTAHVVGQGSPIKALRDKRRAARASDAGGEGAEHEAAGACGVAVTAPEIWRADDGDGGGSNSGGGGYGGGGGGGGSGGGGIDASAARVRSGGRGRGVTRLGDSLDSGLLRGALRDAADGGHAAASVEGDGQSDDRSDADADYLETSDELDAMMASVGIEPIAKVRSI
jgi:hypothetical protein